MDTAGKSTDQFEALEEQYGFLGGSYDEYVKYLMRPDIPRSMWRFVASRDEVSAIAGVSAVPKKDGRQRKLLMQCSANYMFSDVRLRSELGMMGGSALGGLHAPADRWSVSSWDESNAFSYVETPPWMWRWCCGPAVRAGDVWRLLPTSVSSSLRVNNWVWPQYTRLAMGSSHSVHILMNINLTAVGRTLMASARLSQPDSQRL